jgi:hypothetical protein
VIKGTKLSNFVKQMQPSEMPPKMGFAFAKLDERENLVFCQLVCTYFQMF